MLDCYVCDSLIFTEIARLAIQYKITVFQPTIPLEVYREINKLNLKKAAGPENIPLTFYKKANECISNFLCNLFNKCVEYGVFPSLLKQAKVFPIYQ